MLDHKRMILILKSPILREGNFVPLEGPRYLYFGSWGRSLDEGGFTWSFLFKGYIYSKLKTHVNLTLIGIESGVASRKLRALQLILLYFQFPNLYVVIFHTYSSLLFLSFCFVLEVEIPHQIAFFFLNFPSF